jgi:protein SCO1/2
MGVEYSPKDMRLGLVEASANRIGSPVDNILTYCYHYDPKTNKHSLIVARVVQMGGLVTLFTLGGFMLVMFRRDVRHETWTEAETGIRTKSGTDKKVNG